MKVVLLSALLIFACGCVKFTDEQRKEYALAQADLDAAKVEVEILAVKLSEVGEKLKAAVKQIKEGGTAAAIEEGKKLLAVYNAEKEEVMSRIEVVSDRGESAANRLKKVQASGVPWYQVAGNLALDNAGWIATALLAAFGGTKYLATRRTMGVLTRAGNESPGFGARVHAEVERTPGVTRGMTDTVWRLGMDREI